MFINKVILWILEIFFGLFCLNTLIQFCVSNTNLNWFHGLMWFTSVFIFAFISGMLFE